MKILKISDETYDQLKTFVVDPFDDTPDSVVLRLVEIADKAKNRWSAFEPTDIPDPPRETADDLHEVVL
jgi:hypothetical protein